MSIAGEAGMSFADRYNKANELLREWDRYHQCEGEERVRSKNKIFAALSDQLQIGLDNILASPLMFDDFCKLIRAMYGEDATNLAATDRSAVAQYAARMVKEGAY